MKKYTFTHKVVPDLVLEGWAATGVVEDRAYIYANVYYENDTSTYLAKLRKEDWVIEPVKDPLPTEYGTIIQGQRHGDLVRVTGSPSNRWLYMYSTSGYCETYTDEEVDQHPWKIISRPQMEEES